MPVTNQAKKKLRRDRAREVHNARIRRGVRDAIKAVRKRPTPKTLSLAFTALDTSIKRNIVHKNKAARLKSRLSRLLKKSK